jgi:hypothetical protein
MGGKLWPIPFKYFYSGLLICIFLDACSLMDMDRPIPPTEILWKKNEISDKHKLSDLKYCTKVSSNSNPGEDWNDFDKCMLKKGYKFVPKPEGWRNICALIPESLGCKSARGEIKIKADD